MSNEPGIYTKGDSTKVASTPADAVALVYDGYTRVDDASDEQVEAASVQSTQDGADTGAVGDVSSEVENAASPAVDPGPVNPSSVDPSPFDF